MNRRELETLLLTLESTPALVARAAEGLEPWQVRRAPAPGSFSLVEHVWHLADIEREGYGMRIRRILAEQDPVLADFDGERIARERQYNQRDLATGLAALAAARARNVEKLRRCIHNSDWKRRGVQDGVGPITLEDVPRMMAGHDRAHTEEIATLVAHLKEGKPFQAHPSFAVA
jgi:hypothetical protein